MDKATKHPETVKKRLMSIKEAADEYGASVWFWRSRLWSGDLPFVKVGRKQLIDRQDIEQFIRQHKTVELATN